MKKLATLALVLAACTDEPSSGGPAVDSHVLTWDLPERARNEIDVLFVVDATSTIAPHQAKLASIAGAFADTIATYPVGDLHIGAVVSDGSGALRDIAATTELFLHHDIRYDGTVTNYTGTLASAVSELIDAGAANTGANQPLHAITAATDGRNAGFIRSGAQLSIVTISGDDDASTGEVAGFVSGVKGLKSDPANVVVFGIYPDSMQRLDAFHDAFPDRNSITRIEDNDFTTTFPLLGQLLRTILGVPCAAQPLDVDPTTPGPQYECAFSTWIDGVERQIPMCSDPVTGPCWRFTQTPACAGSAPDTSWELEIEGWGGSFYPNVRGQCVMPGAQ